MAAGASSYAVVLACHRVGGSVGTVNLGYFERTKGMDVSARDGVGAVAKGANASLLRDGVHVGDASCDIGESGVSNVVCMSRNRSIASFEDEGFTEVLDFDICVELRKHCYRCGIGDIVAEVDKRALIVENDVGEVSESMLNESVGLGGDIVSSCEVHDVINGNGVGINPFGSMDVELCSKDKRAVADKLCQINHNVIVFVGKMSG
jgi:hypothetical protein